MSANVPDILLVHTIVERFLPNKFRFTDKTPPVCVGLTDVHTPDTSWIMYSCVSFVNFGSVPFGAGGLANELEERVLAPAHQAQEWVASYPYLTRLYAQLDPEQMNKDLSFAFTAESDDVCCFHRAVGNPLCPAEDPTFPIGMDVNV
jgi:hypothetical protein